MHAHRGPHNSAKCPFYVVFDDPFSAEASLNRCVRCVTYGNALLESLSEDFRQLAFLTLLEEGPKYDPEHPSGASFITFIKSRVCSRLWSERRKELKYLAYPLEEKGSEDNGLEPDPLMASLTADALVCETMEDTIIQQIMVEQFRELLPQFLKKLSEKERVVLRMKYFEERSGAEIALVLSVSEGRVSQLGKSGFAKLKKAYLSAISDPCFENN